MQVTLDIHVPDGYVFVRYGVPEIGELFIDAMNGEVNIRHECAGPRFPRIILRRLPPKPWRAEKGGEYWVLFFGRTVGHRSQMVRENGSDWDNQHYDEGNYFRTRDQSQAVDDEIEAATLAILAKHREKNMKETTP